MRGVLLAVACAVMLAGCTSGTQRDPATSPPTDLPPPPGQPPTMPPAPPTVPPPRIVVTLDRAAFRAGDPVTITATFTNTANETFQWTTRGCGRIQVWVEDVRPPPPPFAGGERNAHGTNLPLWPASGAYGCLAAELPMQVAPGETVREVVVWNGAADDDAGAAFAPSGRYVIRADFDGMYGSIAQDWPTAGATTVTMEGNGSELIGYLSQGFHSRTVGIYVYPNATANATLPARCVAAAGPDEPAEAVCVVVNQSMELPSGGGPATTVPWTVRATWPDNLPHRTIWAFDAQGGVVARWAGVVAPWADFVTE